MSNGMNYSTALFLASDKLIAVRAAYETVPENFDPLVDKFALKQELFKTFDTTVAVGDVVVVPTTTNKRHGFTTVKVTQVGVEVDFDSDELCRWIVAKIDMTDYNAVKDKETKAINLMKGAEALDRKKKLRDKMSSFFADPAVQALQIVDLSAETDANPVAKAN